MPRPRTSSFWVDKIRAIVEKNERTTIAEIARLLESEAQDLGLPIAEVPSDSTIKRERQTYIGLDPEVRRRYRFVYWPETFDLGGLPWEAAPAVGELLKVTLPYGARVPVKYALQFWRVSAVAPELSFSWRRILALLLRVSEMDVGEEGNAIRRDVEAVLFGSATTTTPSDVVLPIEGLPLLLETMQAAGMRLDKDAIAGWVSANPRSQFRIALEEEQNDSQG